MIGASQVALVVENAPAKAGDMRCIRSLGEEHPLEEVMAPYSSILAWIIPWAEEPGRPQSMGCKEVDVTELLSTQARTQHLAVLWKGPHA